MTQRRKKSTSAKVASSKAGSGINQEWFFAQFENIGFSLRKMARALEIDPSSLSYTLSGKRRLQMSEAVAMAKILGRSLHEVLANAGLETEASASDSVSVVGWVDNEGVLHLERPRGPKSAPRPAGAVDGTQALRFQTAGSSLDAFDGALAYYLPQARIHPDALGRLSVIEVPGQRRSRVGVLRRGYSPGTYHVASLDGQLLVEDARVVSAVPILCVKF